MIPLHVRDGHIFLEIDGGLWLFDTGAPTSFGSAPEIALAGVECRLADQFLGMTAATLSGFLSFQCAGLLGADVLGQFDFLLDLPHGAAEVSSARLECAGHAVSLELFLGIPIVLVRMGDVTLRMFFDTGAQLSYVQHDSLAQYPPAGRFTDFYPGFGQFQTDTHQVNLVLGDVPFVLRCGTLPETLAAILMMAGTEGIIGNHTLCDRQAGYFPRRNLLVL